jgi:toxin CcdB
MAKQFDLYRLSEGDFVVILQSDIFEDLNTRVVCLAVPETSSAKALPHLSPVLTAGDMRLRISPQVVATLTITELGTHIATLQHERDRIIRAVDLMLTGS